MNLAISTTARVGVELIQLLGAGKINEFLINRPQSYQDAFEKQYMAYMQQNDRLYDIAVEGATNEVPTTVRCGYWSVC